ncbi:RHS repeat domain-containing protein [Pseudomonas sp. NPDC087639]|uniref:RHS repeat domain-containing protein n=1 Tax=Pseudomonas sp. NPDC087639 TaxID=3364445 RepID=UPI003803A0B9
MNPAGHWHTPTLSVSDGRGLPVRQVGYLRTVTADTPLVSRQQHDVAGRLVAQWDPRLPVPCLTTVYDLGGAVLKSDSVDSGWRLSLPGLAGEPLQRWDAREGRWCTTFDNQLRVVTIEENAEANVDAFTYAGANADAEFNQRGQLLEVKDRSSTLRTDCFAIDGQPLTQTRTLPDGEAFTSRQVFSPLGVVLTHNDAGGHQQQSLYGLGGQLKQVQLRVSGDSDWQPVLLDAQYNAAGQLIEQKTGNGVISQWTYDPGDGRLRTQSSRKGAGPVLQSFEYFYDQVGNITLIEDHAFEPIYFANQLVDGHRDFTYDSLYQLTSATGYDDGPLSDIPGQPQPTDPKNRLNYTQTYQYDPAGNLIKLCHLREGACQTREMRIDPLSNRGARWKPGDPDPVFDTVFDRHGNQQNVQAGQPLNWNARDQLQRVILIHRDDGRHDAEYYHYSQGMRVLKRHETFTDTADHFHQVVYLPGLEIRTRDNGEELHVINLSIGVGNVRCLHWAQKKPDGIEIDQLRYSLDDHLGSCAMELDGQAQLISHEGYYPFGATAWMAARSVIEVTYRFIRYSGKEMDVSGLYYYGARYYAPWLQRWVSADPAGAVDGLNLYGFVGNNPIVFIDNVGQMREWFSESTQQRDARKAQSSADRQVYVTNMQLSQAVNRHLKILEIIDLRVRAVESQVKNLQSGDALAANAAKRVGTFVAKQAISYGVGIGVGAVGGLLGTAAGPVGTAFGIALGFAAKAATGVALDYVADKQGLSTSVVLKSRKLDPARVVQRGEYKTASLGSYGYQKFQKTFEAATNPTELTMLKGFKGVSTTVASAAMKANGTPVSAEIGAILGTLLGAAEIVYEIESARNGMTPEMQGKFEILNQHVPGLIDVLQRGLAEVNSSFDAANRDSIHTYRMFSKIFGSAPGDTRQSVADATSATVGNLKKLQSILK